MLHRPACPVARVLRPRKLHRRTAAVLFGILLTLSGPALAAEPSVEECLAASDASIELETRERLLDARSALRTCAELACPREIREECARRIELVDERIPSVLIEVRDSSGRPHPNPSVVVDGVPVVLAESGVELDPGAHTLTAGTGMPPVSRSFSAKAGEKQQRVRLMLPAPVVPARRSLRGGSQRTVALVVGGVGAGSLVAGSVFALVALDRKRAAEEICPDDPCSSSAGAERWDRARHAGNVATALAIGGGVAVAVAAGLWFSAPQQSVEVGLGPTRLELKARF